MLSVMTMQRHTEKFIAVPFTTILTCSTCICQKAWNTEFMFLSNNCLKQCLERFTGLENFFNRWHKNSIDWELQLAYICKAHCINVNISCMVFILHIFMLQ